MKPLNLTPAYKDYIWGGTKLKTKYGKKVDIFPLAESWELSCHKDGLSIIDGGEFNGQTLASVIEKNPVFSGDIAMVTNYPYLSNILMLQMI